MDKMAEMRARIAAKLASIPTNISKAPVIVESRSESIAVIEQPAAEEINIIEPLTEDSAIVKELEETEQDDSNYIIIGGQVFSKENPFFAKMMDVWEKDELAKTGSIEKLSVDERLALCEPHELAQMLFNKELAKEFGVPDLAMYREIFNTETVKVKNLTIAEIDERIKKHQEYVKHMNTLIQASVAVRYEKSKREKIESRKDSDSEFKKSNSERIKSRLAARKVSSGLSEEEKLIQKFMKMGMTREKALRLLKEE